MFRRSLNFYARVGIINLDEAKSRDGISAGVGVHGLFAGRFLRALSDEFFYAVHLHANVHCALCPYCS